MSITAWIAKIGTNPTFIAAQAHIWFACTLTLVGVPWWITVMTSAVKEYVFDHLYEKDPPQTTWDNTTDWLGYCLGVAIALGYNALK